MPQVNKPEVWSSGSGANPSMAESVTPPGSPATPSPSSATPSPPEPRPQLEPQRKRRNSGREQKRSKKPKVEKGSLHEVLDIETKGKS